jgi:phosphopantothenoylcysteine decarboxylase/phosphopantothenate--cysteine ligase
MSSRRRVLTAASALEPPNVLITAGPTHEPVDAVRYIANRSSGRLGIALAEAAAARHDHVTLLLGPTPLSPPQHSHVTTRRFQTAAELRDLLAELWPGHSVLIMAAAVADYRPAESPDMTAKHLRGDGPWMLELTPTPDLLAEAAGNARPDQFTVGFALGPAEGLLDRAREKLAAKHVDAIVANPLETMGADCIQATLLLRDGRELSVPACSKTRFAVWLLDRVDEIRGTRPSSPAAPGSR